MNTTAQPQEGEIRLEEKPPLRRLPDENALSSGKQSLRPYEVLVWGTGALPPPVWDLPPANPELEAAEGFYNCVRRRAERRAKAYEEAGRTPPHVKDSLAD